MKKVALTGGLCSGKSTVCQLLKEKGAYIVSADAVVHDLLKNPLIGNRVIELLGNEVLTDSILDRKKIADKVFGNRKLLLALEELLHPAVRQQIQALYDQEAEKGISSLFIAEIPLLFEGDFDNQYDATIAVITDEAICKERYKKRGSLKDDFFERAGRQLPQKVKAKRADHLLQNNGDLLQLRKKVDELWNKLISDSSA